MRIEYMIVSFVILAVVLYVALSMLTGVMPGIDAIFKLLGG